MTIRNIFERAFWRDFWLDLRRFKKHDQARKAVGVRLLLILFLFAYVAYYWFLFHSLQDPVTELAMGCLLTLIFLVIGTVRYSQWREARAQLRKDIAEAPLEVSERLTKYAHALTAMSERALSELYLHKHALPEGFEIATRRLKIQSLKATGAWEEIPPDVRGWMMRADGEWPVMTALGVLTGSEVLHTLLWALALLPNLRPLDELLKPLNFPKLANMLTKKPRGVLPTWELRVKRNEADVFLTRCYAEGVVRGHVKVDDEEQGAAIHDWISAIGEHRESEFFVGAESIRELTNDDLWNARKAAALRLLTLNHIMELLDSRPVWEGFCSVVFHPLTQREEVRVETNMEMSESNVY